MRIDSTEPLIRFRKLFIKQFFTTSSSQSSTSLIIPFLCRRYIERSFMTTPAADKDKLREYLEKRLRPLLTSGAVRAVKWDAEPLPHTRNYQLPGWIPTASKTTPVKEDHREDRKPPGFSWAPPPRAGETNQRRRRRSSEEDKGDRKRGWFEDREPRRESPPTASDESPAKKAWHTVVLGAVEREV